MALTGNWPMQNKIFFVFTTLSIWIALFIEPDKIYEWLLKRDIKKSLRK